MTWGLAQAGNRAGRTGRYLQWWDRGPEWDAVTSALQNPHDTASFFECLRILKLWGAILKEKSAPTRIRTHSQKGLRDRNSPFCTLSQNGYGERFARERATRRARRPFKSG